jgi:putative transposase
VHLIRASLRFVPDKDRRAVARDLEPIYTASDRDQAWDELERFADRWEPSTR